MKLSANWIRDFAELKVDDHRLAEDLTSIGIAAEGISGSGEKAVFDMEIGTNRPDASDYEIERAPITVRLIRLVTPEGRVRVCVFHAKRTAIPRQSES